MRHADVVIVGGGLAGATAGAMLGQAGIDAVVVDPHSPYPPDFRSEKLDALQVRLLHKTGLAEAVLRSATPMDELWIARFGRLVEKRRNNQYGIAYDCLVNAIRAEIPQSTPLTIAKVTAVSAGPDRQAVTLSNGDEISARLIVLATGLNNALRRTLGMVREDVSTSHSISIGFDVRPIGRPGFEFRALTYHGENPSEQIAYLSVFPMGSTIRANLFVYRSPRDPWLGQFREAPQRTAFAAMPGLEKLMGDFDVTSEIKIRPVDLYVTTGYRQAGVVLVGDAFATSCPAAGTGATKVFTDVERLCHVHIPRWLATEGMGEEKIAAFYDDPVKTECDLRCAALAYYVRSMALDGGLPWRARRWGKFMGQLAVGMLRQARERPPAGSPSRQGAPAGSGAAP